jgi:hypothetical protein
MMDLPEEGEALELPASCRRTSRRTNPGDGADVRMGVP